MCGRFALHHCAAEIAAQFAVEQLAVELPPRYNIAPSQPVAVVLQRQGRVLEAFQWGLVPFWARDARIGSRMINARAETLAEKPAYKAALTRRRCLIPASGFFEWKKAGKQKRPLYIHQTTGHPFALAGLWEKWTSPQDQPLYSCTIVTTEANPFMASIHARMPVILTPEQQHAWLDPRQDDPRELLSLLHPYAGDTLTAYPVASRVNVPTYDAPDCIAPVEREEEGTMLI
jgi:putative SOS response-associated peptidase YedK